MTHGSRWLHLLVVTVLLLAAFGSAPPVARAASTVVVTTTLDLTGNSCGADPLNPTLCSLRQAIQQVNALPNGESATIEFNISNNDPGYDGSDLSARTWTITLLNNPLNFVLQGNTLIDGNSQARYRGGNPNVYGPEIIIDGRNITTAGGILLYSNNNTVLGLGIVNFAGGNPTGTGIEIAGSNNKIQGNYIGLNKYGTTALPNTGPGVWVRGDNNQIGGDSSVSTTEFNVISGNLGDGILVDGLGVDNNGDPLVADNNQIRGNYIGTARGGLSAVPNGINGINVRIGAKGTLIGTDPGSGNAVFRNVISGNRKFGIVVRDSQANGIYGNWIGIDDTGDFQLANGTGGIQVLGEGGIPTGDNRIGGPSGFARNVITANNGPGINIRGPYATGVTVANNNIGLNFSNGLPISGTTPLRTQTFGVLIEEGAYGNNIGGSTLSERNVISGNNGPGVYIVGNPNFNLYSNDNYVVGNNIGTGVAIAERFPNAGSGVRIGTFADYNRVGGSATGEGNTIAYNDAHGVHLVTGDIDHTQIRRNTISLNALNGVFVDGSRITDIVGNTIRSNAVNGVALLGTSFTTVAGEATDARSSITGNGADAINASGGVTLTVQYVDTTPIVLPNGGDGVDATNDDFTYIFNNTLTRNGGLGIRLTNSDDVQIAGDDLGAKNLVTENPLGGVLLTNVVSATLTYNELSNNGAANSPGDGLGIVGGERITALSNSATNNFGAGMRANGTQVLRFESASDGTSNPVTFNRQGGLRLTAVTSATLRFNSVNNNYDDGIRVDGGSDDVVITRNFVQLNGPQNMQNGVCPAFTNAALERGVAGQGVSVRDSATRRVQILRNRFGRNCGLAILREPNTVTGSNDGIQPPFNLSLSKLSPTTAIVGGKVALSGAGGCPGCTVELYEADPAFTPDGEGFRKLNTPEDYITFFDEQGNFSYTLSRIPKQLLATATDKFGNTSEFAVFTARYGIDIEPDRMQHAYPTQVITYYHTVTNNGTVGDTFALSVEAPAAWTASAQPAGPFALIAGKSIPVTVTLKLPVGTAPTARANTSQLTFVRATAVYSAAITDYVTDTTVVDPKVVIDVLPPTLSGEVQATKTITYAHQIINNGNITATVDLSFNSVPAWPTVLSANTLTLAPGDKRGITVSVTPPNGTGQNATAQTFVTVAVREDSSQSKPITDTTKVVVTPRVIITPPVVNGDGAADKVTTYTDFIVLNISNGAVRLRLSGVSTFGATLAFRTVGGAPLESGNRFTLGTTPNGNPSNQLQLAVDVRLPRIIPTGAVDVTTIQVLDDASGAVLAVAQARTTVRQGRTIVYLPLVFRPV